VRDSIAHALDQRRVDRFPIGHDDTNTTHRKSTSQKVYHATFQSSVEEHLLNEPPRHSLNEPPSPAKTRKTSNQRLEIGFPCNIDQETSWADQYEGARATEMNGLKGHCLVFARANEI